jgi:hypothetical protein
MGLSELRRVLDFNRRKDDDLNNRINAIKVKYNMSDDDLAIVNTAISILTTRALSSKLGLK